MKSKFVAFAVAASWLVVGISVNAAAPTTLSFEDLAEGSILADQYVGLGVRFSPNAFVGDGGPTGPWATNTDMTITSSDVNNLGTLDLVTGNLLRTFTAWTDEDGDPSFRIDFAAPIDFFSAAFASVARGPDVRLFFYDGSTLLGAVAGPENSSEANQFVLSYSSLSFDSVVVTPGSFADWVGVDNVTFTLVEALPPEPPVPPVTPIPEASTSAMMALGLTLLTMLNARRVNCSSGGMVRLILPKRSKRLATPH